MRGVGAVVEQPDAHVHPRLARTDDHVLVVVVGDTREIVERNAAGVGGDGVRRCRRRRNEHLGMCCVHESTCLDADPFAREPRRDDLVISELARREPPHASRWEEPLTHHAVVVAEDLLARRQLLEADVQPDLVDRAESQRGGVDAVAARRLVQPHERVGVVPVPARAMVSVDDHHRGAALGQQRIGERHGRGTAPHDQIVGFDGRFGHGPPDVSINWRVDGLTTVAHCSSVISRPGPNRHPGQSAWPVWRRNVSESHRSVRREIRPSRTSNHITPGMSIGVPSYSASNR